jgi:hypothetical protein
MSRNSRAAPTKPSRFFFFGGYGAWKMVRRRRLSAEKSAAVVSGLDKYIIT